MAQCPGLASSGQVAQNTAVGYSELSEVHPGYPWAVTPATEAGLRTPLKPQCHQRVQVKEFPGVMLGPGRDAGSPLHADTGRVCGQGTEQGELQWPQKS